MWQAHMLVGLRLGAVRYFDIDYFREEIAADQAGPREITGDAEWRDPIWSCSGFDSVDYGIELVMLGGRVFSVMWDPPGMRECIGMREVPLGGTGFRRRRRRCRLGRQPSAWIIRMSC